MSTRKQRLRAKVIREMQEKLHVDQELAERVYDNQIAPQQLVHEARELGIDMDVQLVDVTPGADDGYLLTCGGCGRTARSPRPAPPGQIAVCPPCQRAGRGA